MGIITYPTKLIKPLGVYAYIDRIQVWLKTPAGGNCLAFLQPRCGHIFVESKSAHFDDRFRQRIEMKQPQPEALEWIAASDGALVNRIDLAIDYCCHSIEERDELYEFLDLHLIRRWHNPSHAIFVYPGKNETRYDSPRKARSSLVAYKEPSSRITGEGNVTRIEWRATGVRSVRRCGIGPKQLDGFSHRRFWEDRLVLMTVDKERLGRFLRNIHRKSKSRRAEIVGGLNLDRRRGHVLLSSVSNFQELIDAYRKPFRIGRLLERMSVPELLPA